MAKTPKETGRFAALKQYRDAISSKDPANEAEVIDTTDNDERFSAPPAEDVEEQTKPPARRVGRPRGKRSDPDYAQATILIRRRNKRIAQHIIEDMHRYKPHPSLWPKGYFFEDFSGLVDQLLEQWVQEHEAYYRKLLKNS